ncbi:MAG: MMPL family transporter [Pirellulales bacterium]|nr:MMPL family transporter [Pirellulales bacterium]
MLVRGVFAENDGPLLDRFLMDPPRFLGRRRRLLIFLLFVVSYPFILHGATCAWFSTANRVADWLPRNFEETRKLMWFAERFGSDEILMVSWIGCSCNDPRLPKLAEALKAPVPDPDGEKPRLFRVAMTSPEVLKSLMEPPLELPRDEAVKRLEGWLVGRDGITSCLVALVSEAGIEDRKAAVDRVYKCAEDCGLRHEDIIMAGSTVDGVAIDRISLAALLELNGASLVVCFLLTCLFLRSLRLAVLVFVSAVFCQQLGMAMVYYTGSQMDSVLLMIASLAFVLVTSGAVHLVNYYADAARENGLDGAPRRALRAALVPCTLAAGTTAMGLGSLVVSKILPIARFGWYGAAVVLAGLAIIFLWIPSALEQWPPQRWFARLKTMPESRTHRVWNSWGQVVTNHAGKILVVTLLVMGVTGWAIQNVRTTARLHDLLPSDSRVIRDYRWLEEHIGPLVPVEVVLVMPKEQRASILDRLLLVERVRGAIDKIAVVGSTISAGNFGPVLPSARTSIRSVTQRTVLRRKLERHRDDFIESGYLVDSDASELWRISVHVPAGAKVDYAAFLDELRRTVDPVLLADDLVGGVRAEFCGGVPLIHKAQEQLLTDLIESFLLAFVLIAVAMAVLLRSPIAGALSMIPNLLPCVLVFGVMGWLGTKIEIGAVMTASVALGVAVDGTLHFVTWFRRGIRQGMNQPQAVHFAYSRCATAMVQSSMICGLGLLVFVGSDFVPIHRFAWLMFTLLSAALVSDIVVTPAILAGPLGRFFKPRSS